MSNPIAPFVSRVLHLFEIRRIRGKENSVYLTFDDGPEPHITEFVLNELDKYGYKATFFCRGDNAEHYPLLLQRLKDEGHAIGNHTYSHIKSSNVSAKEYVADVERANIVLRTKLFRPPWGNITLLSFLRLCRRYKIVYWSLLSGDTERDKLDVISNLNRLKEKTRGGDVVLFHFCQLHENETRKILPDYLEWLHQKGYQCDLIQ